MASNILYTSRIRSALWDLIEEIKAGIAQQEKEEPPNFPAYMVLHNQFYYITDLLNIRNIFIHPHVSNVLGYEPEECMDLDFIGSIMHPDDKEFVIAFSLKSIRFSNYVKEYLLRNISAGTFSIDFRMRKKDNQYVRINRLTAPVKLDCTGRMTHAVSFYTDITHLKKSNVIACSFLSNVDVEFNTEDLYNEFGFPVISKREHEILKLLAQGFSGGEVANKLFISKHTVITHRKNLLRKTQTRNTGSLIKYAAETGLL